MRSTYIVHIVLPLKLKKPYSYRYTLESAPQVGMRVEVPFRKKHYTGIIWSMDQSQDDNLINKLGEVIRVLDTKPIISKIYLEFWQWISDYYCCGLGEVMRAALPAGYRLESEYHIQLNENINIEHLILDSAEQDLIDLVKSMDEVSIQVAQSILSDKQGLKLIQSMVERNIIVINTTLKSPIKVKADQWISIAQPFDTQIDDAFSLCTNAPKQTDLLLTLFQETKRTGYVKRKTLSKAKSYQSTLLKALEKKGIIVIEELHHSPGQLNHSYKQDLSQVQEKALLEIQNSPKPALLHGVTGSGKTHIYIKLIKEALADGGQVLFMLPEVALTTQLVHRLQDYFSDFLHVYHYRTTQHQRMLIWQQAQLGSPMLVVGPRSCLFIPFKQLDLIVVDEEHDPSYKQEDPAPRYHGRDSALYLAHLFNAQIVLGSATPSLESYLNGQKNKFNYIKINERFGESILPEINIIDRTQEDHKSRSNILSPRLKDAIDQTLKEDKQVLLFLNRRGFFTIIFCTSCDWKAGCPHCDVSLTYHKVTGQLRCHSCGYTRNVIKNCPDCGAPITEQSGYGTQRISEETQALFPNHNLTRLDADVTRSISKYDTILQSFADREIDILIGTQLITKGLDFDHVGLVGVIQGDQILNYPNFRSVEYTYQLLTQVSGRAGRKKDQGRVFIQTSQAQHPIYQIIKNNQVDQYYDSELKERKAFYYPPYTRLINVELRHKNRAKLHQAVEVWMRHNGPELMDIVSGPATPSQERLRNLYRSQLIYRLLKDNKSIARIKRKLNIAMESVLRTKGLTQTRIIINVDPV